MARKRTKVEVEAMVSGSRFLADFITKFIELVCERGGSSEDVHRLVTKDGEATLTKIVDLIVSPHHQGVTSKQIGNIFQVTVDYTKSLAEMISAGKYNWENSNINEKNFPSPQIPSGSPTKVALQMELVHFNRLISSENAIAELKKLNLRPATLWELLAFGSTYPDKQKEFPIVALGSTWRGLGGGRDVAYLGGCGVRRDLRLGWFGGGWGECCRFLAVRESSI